MWFKVSLALHKIYRVIPDKDAAGDEDLRVIDESGVSVGHINFRVGDTRHVNTVAGHIGFGIHDEFRGRSYSYHACRALAPFIRRHYKKVILTADPDNYPSLRIMEKLHAVFLEQIEVPSDDPAYARGARKKRRFEWTP